MVISLLKKREFSVVILKVYMHMEFPKIIDSKISCIAICFSCRVTLMQFYSIQLTAFFDILKISTLELATDSFKFLVILVEFFSFSENVPR